jgi:uncharacterized cupredoxin-like copper-binding protein
MKGRTGFLFGFIVVIAALVLSACGGPKKAEYSVEMKDFSFTPNTATVPAGAEVTLNLKNSGALEHEYVIIKKGEKVTVPFDDDDEAKVFWEHELDAGESATVTYTAPTEPGEYTVVCGTPGHLEQNMAGTLVVK